MLKRLELVGFKSFADRTWFTFPPGLTAVVGPNGSGKSNVVDAVKWILGEQSAKSLRGGEMADVIFNGSSSRKALGLAEVTLTLDNSRRELNLDAAEVVGGY
jgi:chromosome segregation protein